MSHQPYETFLFTDEPLTLEQRQSLDSHLMECARCRALAGALLSVNQALATNPAPAPAPGFTQRWYARLSEHRHERQQRNLWLLTLGLFALAGLILLILGLLHLLHFNWAYGFSQFIANFSLFAARLRHISSIMRSLTESLPLILPMMILFGIGTVLAASALTVTWFSSLIRLYSPIDIKGQIK
jgi:anti-sigma factor RsiW